MMEQSELSKIIAILTVAYPYYFKNMDEKDILDMFSVYKSQFKDFCYPVMSRAINVLIKVSKYLPSIAEIYQECINQELDFFKEVLEKNTSIPADRKRILEDSLWWLCNQGGIPKEIKEEILRYYNAIPNEERLKIGE